MRCIIGFFGITRSLRHTIGSIQGGFYEPLDRDGIVRLTAGHFNLPAMINNPRSGEFNLLADRSEADLLDLDLRRLEPQADENIVPYFTIANLFPDHFGDEYKSLFNLCQQLYSLSQLWSLINVIAPSDNDYFLFLRPDLFYCDRFDPVIDLAPLVEDRADLIVPTWQGWGGLNDRFAFCTRRGAEIYATRIRSMIEVCVELGGVHSESLLAIVARNHGLRVRHTAIRAVRIRANGMIAGNDLEMLPHCPPELVARYRQPLAVVAGA